jgi:DNA repair exonuclease SbcCD ATPase subunit
MSVVLKKLTFSNMFSYGTDNVLELNNNTVTQLIASNGTGKSSLAIIIQELLFNKNIKGLKKSDILNRYSGSKTWEGRLDFTVDGIDYAVISKRTGASTNVVFLKEGKDISEHKVLDTYKAISEVLGRDFETFSQLTYQSSTDSLEFLKATDSNRKKFLINLFNLERYIEIGDHLKSVVSAKEKELTSKQGELKTVLSFIETNKVPEKASEQPVPDIDTSLYSKIDALKAQIIAQRKICDSIDQNNLRIKERDSLRFEVSLMPVEIPESLTVDIKNLNTQVNQKQSNLTRLKKDLKSLDLSDTCYACKQPIDNSQSKKLSDELKEDIVNTSAHIEALSKELDTLSTKLKKLEQDKYKYELNQKTIDRFTTLSQLIDSTIPSQYPDYDKLSRDLKELEKELSWQEKSNKDAKANNDSVKIRNAKIDALVEQLRNFKARQELLNNDIVAIQEEISTLAILKKAFSTSGIVAFKLENVTKQLEESINKYLAMLSDGQFQIVFRLDGEKLNIIVINNGQEVTIDSLSGGEFSRVQTSVLLAVRQTLATIGGKNINLLFLDEITGVLDDSGKERLFEVLQEEKDLNVFLISHDYSHPLVPKVEIIKENNISSINR